MPMRFAPDSFTVRFGRLGILGPVRRFWRLGIVDLSRRGNRFESSNIFIFRNHTVQSLEELLTKYKNKIARKKNGSCL